MIDWNTARDLVEVATYGGYNDWLLTTCVGRLRRTCETGRRGLRVIGSTSVAKGAEDWLYPQTTPTIYTRITLGMMKGAIRTLRRDGHTIRLDDIDSETAGMILQQAIYGEVVFS